MFAFACALKKRLDALPSTFRRFIARSPGLQADCRGETKESSHGVCWCARNCRCMRESVVREMKLSDHAWHMRGGLGGWGGPRIFALVCARGDGLHDEIRTPRIPQN